MPNVSLTPFKDASSFRRIAAMAWGNPRDPSIYGTMHIPGEALHAWLEAKRAAGQKLTVTHAVARAVALSLAEHRDLNAMVRFGKLYLRRDVDVFVQVAIPSEEHVGKTDLSGVVIRNAEQKSIDDIAAEIRAGARKIRRNEDAEFRRTKAQAEAIPTFLYRWLLKLVEFLQFVVNVDTSFLGAPRDPFGSAMVTSLGMHGVEIAYAPFFPLARCPMVVLVGALADAPAVVDGELAVQKQLTLSATFDHRIIDGFHAATFARTMRGFLTQPERLDG